MITRFGKIHERDGRTDGRTLHDSNGRACIVPLSADFCIFFPDCHGLTALMSLYLGITAQL